MQSPVEHGPWVAEEADCCRCSLVADDDVVVDVLITFEVDVREAALPSIGLNIRGTSEDRSFSLFSQMPYPWWFESLSYVMHYACSADTFRCMFSSCKLFFDNGVGQLCIRAPPPATRYVKEA